LILFRSYPTWISGFVFVLFLNSAKAQSLCPEQTSLRQEGAYQVSTLSFKAPREAASAALDETIKKLGELGYQDDATSRDGTIRVQLPPVAKDKSYFELRLKALGNDADEALLQARVQTHRQQPLGRQSGRQLMCYLMGNVLGQYRWEKEPVSYRGLQLGVALAEQMQACPEPPKPSKATWPAPPQVALPQVKGPCYRFGGRDSLASHLQDPQTPVSVNIHLVPSIGTYNDAMVIRLLNGKVESIKDVHSQNDFAALKQLLTQKYGAPHEVLEKEDGVLLYQWQGKNVGMRMFSNVPKYTPLAKATANADVLVPWWMAPIAAIGMGMLEQETSRGLAVIRVDTQTYKESEVQLQQAQDQKSGKAQALDRL
jgi:hypothetical protein